MGYTTYFEGSVTVSPPLSAEEVQFLNKFSETRRMNRTKGPYFVDGSGDFGQGADDDVINHNSPDPSQPGLWCHWVASDDGTEIMWDDGEKFYESEAWMAYIIQHFVGPTPLAQSELPFLTGHRIDGVITASGEEDDDHWKLKVDDSSVYRVEGGVTFEDELPEPEPERDLSPVEDTLAMTRIHIRNLRQHFDEQFDGKTELTMRRETMEVMIRDLEEASGIR